MDRIRICKNKCIFCFISQLPKGMRSSLYLRDDDYIESFTHGNFITLTNVTKNEIKKIIRFELKQLNVSLHSFNQKIRNTIFGNKTNKVGIINLKKLDRSGITTNIQIVLCPGINDGRDLKSTLDILINKFKSILSIGIVPVGITKYNKDPRLKAFDMHSSKKIIDFIKDYKIKNRYKKNSERIYLSDEFYIIASEKFPEYDSYGKFEQIQNGIGKTVDFINDINNYFLGCNNKEHIISKNNILLVTSEYGKKVFDMVVSMFKRFKIILGLKGNLNISFLVVKNDLFGGNVKATGVLTGRDILNSLKKIKIEKYDEILVPSVIFNRNGVTLDDYSHRDFNKISNKIRFIKDNGKCIAKKIIKKR